MPQRPRVLSDRLHHHPQPVNPEAADYLVLYQKKSGRKRLVDIEKILRQFLDSQGIGYHFLALDELPSSEALDIGAMQKRYRFGRIIVAGGDGTIRRIAEHLYFHQLDLPIAIFPSGSANTLGRILGISSQKKALQTIAEGKVAEVRAGVLNDEHLFLIAASFGHVSLPTIRAHDYYKHQIGFLAYILAALPLLFRFRRTRVRIEPDGEEVKAHSIIALPYKDAKALRMVTGESTGMNVLIFKGSSFINFLWTTLFLLFRQRESASVEIRHAQRFSFYADFAGTVHLDGDIINADDKYTLTLAEQPLKFLVPPEGKRVYK